jgi:hypothetical protein
LYEIGLCGGTLSPLGVGCGKTGLDFLAPMVLPSRRAVLFVPPTLVGQLIGDYLAWREHFRVPSLVVGDRNWPSTDGGPVLHVVPYSKFSRAGSTDLLEELRPDLIIADEAHRLRHRETSTTSRVLRYFADHPETLFCAWSGTITSRSIADFAHLAAHALGEGSPLPLDPRVVAVWAAAVDPSDWPTPAGALQVFGLPVRDGLARRIVETRGVVAVSSSDSCGASIVLRERVPPPLPTAVDECLRVLRKTWVRPDGEELIEALPVARCAHELSCGFYYRWKFSRGETDAQIAEWLAARKDYRREARGVLATRRPHLDSPHLVELAAQRYEENYVGDLPAVRLDAWPRWRAVRDSVRPATEAVWVDAWLARDAAAWAAENRGIVWYEHRAFGERVATLSGFLLYCGGVEADAAARAEKGARSLVVSIKARRDGTDWLQRHFSEQLISSPPADGGQWEQLLGRMHRRGQRADEVSADVYRHTPEVRDAIDTAVRRAKYIEGITTGAQKLLGADVEW